jgi:hypothetical protein
MRAKSFATDLAAGLFLMLSLGSSIHAQDSGATVFMGAKSDVGWGITATQDGGYLVVGGTDSVGAGKEDGLILKLDAQRHIQWSLVLGGSLDDEFEQAVQTPDGGYAVCGGSYSFNHVGSSGWATPWLVRLNSSGQVLWQKYYIRPVAAWVWRIVNTRDGGFALCGVWWAPSTSGYPPQYSYLMKLSAAGEVQWQKAFGPDDVILKGLCQLSTGGFAAVGYCYNAGIPRPLEGILRLDENGDLLWYRRFDIPNDYNSSESPASVIEAPDGGVVVGGGNPGQIRKLDRDGNTLWSQRADIPLVYEDWATIHSLIPIQGGGYLAAGQYTHISQYSSEDFFGPLLARIEEDGGIRWSRVFGDNAETLRASSACATPDGGVAFVGSIPSHTDNAGTVLVRTDSSGSLTAPCLVTRDTIALWTTDRSLESTDHLDPIQADCATLIPDCPSAIATLDSEDTFCPVIRSVAILALPFRLDVRGFHLAAGEMVYIDGQQAPGTKYKSSSQVIGKGGDVLKRMLPKGKAVCVQVGVPTIPPYSSDCFVFRR